MATNNNSSSAAREARRRKIVDRGADRLALITARIQTLPSDESNGLSSAPSSNDPPIARLSDQTTVCSNDDENGSSIAFGSTLSNGDATIIDSGCGETNVEAPLPDCVTTIEPSRDLASDLNNMNMQASLPSSTIQESTMLTASGPNQQLVRFFTPSQISTAISASERSRLVCSVTIALLVVLSYLGFPLLGANIIKSIIRFWPLYLVLVTNASLVLVRLLFNNQRGHERLVGGEWKIPSTGSANWAEQASKALEAGLVMQKAIDTLLMDCSIYAIIIICGLSFISKFN